MATGLSHIHGKPNFSKSKLRRSSSSWCLPRIMAVAQNQSYWASIEADIDTYLKKAIPVRQPESVFEPMHHLTFAAPRTTASALCVAACELVGGDRSQAMAAAAAIHLMHAAAYTHEHLPLTDRPRPKSMSPMEHKYGPNIELLTGDGLIPFGMELLARSMDPARSNQDGILRVIIEITRAIGSQGVVRGQYEQLVSEQLEINNENELAEYVSRKKEGEMHACGAACGAILGGGAEEEIEKLRNFGVYAGMVQGMKEKAGMQGEIERLKEMAVKELESFKGKEARLQLISGLVEPSLCVA